MRHVSYSVGISFAVHIFPANNTKHYLHTICTAPAQRANISSALGQRVVFAAHD